MRRLATRVLWVWALFRGFIAWNKNQIIENLANVELSRRFQAIARKCDRPSDDPEHAYNASEDIASGVASERVFELLRCFKLRCYRNCKMKKEIEKLERDLALRLECGYMRAA